MALSRRLLRKNPHVAAWHFHSRSKAFRKIVLEQKFNLTDYWYRYEWQGRGSSHNHGLYWFDDSTLPNMENAEDREQFAKIWGYHITSVNPKPEEIGQGGEGDNPLSVDPLHTGVTWEWLDRIVNRCQRHRCSSLYCLRINKKAADEAKEKGEPEPSPACRFFFPHPVRELAELLKRPGKTWWHF